MRRKVETHRSNLSNRRAEGSRSLSPHFVLGIGVLPEAVGTGRLEPGPSVRGGWCSASPPWTPLSYSQRGLGSTAVLLLVIVWKPSTQCSLLNVAPLTCDGGSGEGAGGIKFKNSG